MYLLISILIFLVYIPMIGVAGSFFPQGDEIMHIRSIRESLEAGGSVLPILSGLPNPYKPPLLFWLAMVSDSLFGVSYLAERFVSLIFGWLTALLLYRFLYQTTKSKREAFLLTIAFIFSFASIKFFGLLMMEELLVFFVFLYFYLYQTYKRTRKNYYLAIGHFLIGLGYLLKGPILIVYALLLILSDLFVNVWKFRKNKIHLDWKRFFKNLSLFKTFGLVFLIPLFWIGYLYFFEPVGKELLRFFFITENLGKFATANQPGMRIVWGWLLYSFPFTVSIFYYIHILITSQVKTKNDRLARVIGVYLLSVFILHLLPDRKDPYYVTPFIPLLFILPALFRRKLSFVDTICSKPNLIVTGGFYFFLIIVSVVLREYPLFLLTGFAFVILLTLIQFPKLKFFSIFSAQILFLFLVSFFLIRPLSDPSLTDDIPKIENLCVVADNPWTSMDVQNKLQNTFVKYSPPQMLDSQCANAEFILVYADYLNLKDGYSETKHWLIWKSHITPNISDVSLYFKNKDSNLWKTKVRLWERIQK
ncbi:phospholipid carrier-dependent glycosyltransferase [Leptospira sp. 96542]|nr:phospholipid carrier-dependent glycosyltransferase [Leptospira sp. 96542]